MNQWPDYCRQNSGQSGGLRKQTDTNYLMFPSFDTGHGESLSIVNLCGNSLGFPQLRAESKLKAQLVELRLLCLKIDLDSLLSLYT